MQRPYGDGVREELIIEEEYHNEEYGGYYDYNIVLGEKAITLNDYAFGHDSAVVYADGNYYLYMQEQAEGDFDLLTFIDLENMEYDQAAQRYGHLYGADSVYESYDGGSSYTSIVYPLVNPNSFCIADRAELLGIYDITKRYKKSIKKLAVLR